MKKAILLLGLAVGFMSCEDEVVFNETSLQADINYNHVRFDKHEAYVENGNLLVIGEHEMGMIEISIPSYTFGTRYELANNNFSAKFVSYGEEADTLTFLTEPTFDGYVYLSPAEEQAPGSISGNFAFDMEATEDQGGVLLNATIRFHEGKMLNIPINTNMPETIE